MDQKVEEAYKIFLENLKKKYPKEDLSVIKKAFKYAYEAHRGQKRKSGELYIFHPLATAENLVKLKVKIPLIVASLLHDVPEETEYTLKDIRKEFGLEVSSMVKGITKVGVIKYRGIERYIENLRKMFMAMAADLRVVIIKFADRLHNLDTLDALPKDKQLRIAGESMEIYAPIAGRLGMDEMKSKLEDKSFKYLLPKEYEWVRGLKEQRFKETRAALKKTEKLIEKILTDEKINYIKVYGRVKTLYSLYKKLLKHDRDITRVYDFIAIRIVCKKVSDCYAALGIIHKTLKPLKGRIKDYIAQPKPNGYQSLHTTVFTPDNEILEIQIRTEEMEEEAERGIAAHWHYDEKGAFIMDEKYEWVKDLKNWHKTLMKNREHLEELKIDVFQDWIFVFTPKGDVIELPAGSTPVDYAYRVHTDVGNQCTGSLVNNHIVQLNHVLKSGDLVEILVDKKRKWPNPDWLKFVKTNTAKSKIKTSLGKKPLIDKLLNLK